MGIDVMTCHPCHHKFDHKLWGERRDSPSQKPRRELYLFSNYDCAYHTLTNFNTTATIIRIDARHETRIWRIPHDDGHTPQTAACSFSLSRGSRVRQVSTKSACGESERESLDVRRHRTRECDALRRSPDTLTRITRPPRGLPVRGRRTRDCRLLSSSTRLAHSLTRVRGMRLAAVWSVFVPDSGTNERFRTR